jgi:type III pantothenate kinase
MNLIIDIGNTRTKFSVFNHGEEMISVPVDELSPAHIDLLHNEYPQIDKVILSAVKDYPPELKYICRIISPFSLNLMNPLPCPLKTITHKRNTWEKTGWQG